MATANATLTATVQAKDEASPTLKMVAATMQQLDANTKQSAAVSKEHATQTDAMTSALDKTFSKFTAASLASKAYSLAIQAARQAVAVWVKEIIDGVVALEDLGREATATEKSLGSIKKMMADPEWGKQAWYTQAMAVAYAALSTEMAEAEARVAQRNKAIANQKLDQAAVNMLLEEETAKIQGNDAARSKMAAGLAKLHATDKRQREEAAEWRQEQHQQEIDEWIEAEEFRISRAIELDKRLADKHKANIEKAKKDEADANEVLAEEVAARINAQIGAEKKALETQKSNQAKAADAYKQTAETMGQAFGVGFAGMATGSKDAASTMVKSVVGAAATAIISHAVTAAAGAMAAESSIPIIGPILAVAAGAVMSGLVMALLSKLPSFHEGGVVGSDDGMRLPGMKSNERLVNALVGERFIAPGSVGSGGGVVINISNKGAFAPTSADTKRQAIQIGKVLRRQRRLGYAT